MEGAVAVPLLRIARSMGQECVLGTSAKGVVARCRVHPCLAKVFQFILVQKLGEVLRRLLSPAVSRRAKRARREASLRSATPWRARTGTRSVQSGTARPRLDATSRRLRRRRPLAAGPKQQRLAAWHRPGEAYTGEADTGAPGCRRY